MVLNISKEKAMKYLSLTIAAALIASVSVSTAFSGDPVSLRGANELAKDAEMFKKVRVQSQDGGFKRSWKLQPPSIPHTIGKERINLEENTCLRCHSPEKFKEEKAVKIGDSHFIASDGSKSEKVDGRRYFCTQCHTTQFNTKPLVENVFNSGGN
jgi:cytochrome c-type protein NapB